MENVSISNYLIIKQQKYVLRNIRMSATVYDTVYGDSRCLTQYKRFSLYVIKQTIDILFPIEYMKKYYSCVK